MNISGLYFDPKHGGCLRNITHVGKGTFKIHGVYGNDEGECHEGLAWNADLTSFGDTFRADFTSKECRSKDAYEVVYENGVLRWDDGNTWTRVTPVPGCSCPEDQTGRSLR